MFWIISWENFFVKDIFNKLFYIYSYFKNLFAKIVKIRVSNKENMIIFKPSFLLISSKLFVVIASLLEAIRFWNIGNIFWATRPKPKIEIKIEIRTIKPKDLNFKLR